MVLANSAMNKLVVFTPPGTSNVRNPLREDQYYRNCLTVKGYMQSHHTSYYVGASPATTHYKLRCLGSGLYVDGMGRAPNGANCGQWASSAGYNQQWSIETSGSYVLLRNRATGRYLDGLGRTPNGSTAGQWDRGLSNNQQWTMETVNGNYKFRNRGTGLYLDGMGRTANGSDLGQYSGGSSNNQVFVQEQL